ncbi:MAG: histidine kinase [Gammaproteobacteria bacterium]
MSSVPPSLADVVHAFVSNMPGLVFQFQLRDDGAVAFPYLSEGCAALLGLCTPELAERPQAFLDLIVPEHRQGYLDSMQASRAALSTWNWEGRIAIREWNDYKWINLRATPRRVEGAVQWDGIMTNITAGKLAQEEVVRSRARLAELTAHIENVKEAERARIAREIHDDLGGNLTAIKMALAMLVSRLPPDAPQLLDKAAYVDALVDRTIDSAHRISLDLRPSMLDLGLVPALEWQLKEFEKQNAIACSFDTSDADIDLPLPAATTLFRIFQEALTNIAKHARASRVAVRLRQDGELLHLDIADNGAGIAADARGKPQSFGLRGMRERAASLGGSMSLSDAPGGGTIVAIQIRPGSIPGASDT